MNEVVTASDIYWLTRLDGVGGLLTTVAVLCIIASVVCLVCALIHGDMRITFPSMYRSVPDARSGYFRAVRWLLPLAFVCGFASVLTPSTKEAVAIVVIPRIANNEDVHGLGSDVVGLAREWLDELRPKKAEAK